MIDASSRRLHASANELGQVSWPAGGCVPVIGVIGGTDAAASLIISATVEKRAACMGQMCEKSRRSNHLLARPRVHQSATQRPETRAYASEW
jgi:hypothetical protein